MGQDDENEIFWENPGGPFKMKVAIDKNHSIIRKI